MIKKTFTFYISILLCQPIFAMPNIIQNYEEKTIPTPSATKMKDIISPTKDVLSKADEIYDNEKDDFEAIVKIEKYRVLKSRHQSFLLNKQISLADILSNTVSQNKLSTTNKSILKRKKDEKK
jgi:hypothetical protein